MADLVGKFCEICLAPATRVIHTIADNGEDVGDIIPESEIVFTGGPYYLCSEHIPMELN